MEDYMSPKGDLQVMNVSNDQMKSMNHNDLWDNIHMRIDVLIGTVEWIKTDLIKKGASKHIKEVESLSDSLFSISEVLDSIPSGTKLHAIEEINEQLNDISDHINKMAEEKSLPDHDSVNKLKKLIVDMNNILININERTQRP